MQVAISEAKAQLTELVRRAQAGDEVVLTRHGQPAVRLVPIQRSLTTEERRVILEDLRRGAAEATPGPCAARSQDYLYDENGLPA